MTTFQRNASTAAYYADHPPPATSPVAALAPALACPAILLPALPTPAGLASLASLARTAALLDRWRHAAHAGGLIVGWGAGAALVGLWAAVGWEMVGVELVLAVVGWIGATVADWTQGRDES